MIRNYRLPEQEWWKGRIDEEDGEKGLRWHQKVTPIDIRQVVPRASHKNCVALLGFASDEGVRRNKGRTGAKNGPAHFRKSIGSFAWHLPDVDLFDLGDVLCEGTDLETAHEDLARSITKVIDQGFFPIVIGGGHEVAFGSFSGLFYAQKSQKKKIGIINLDAHFDLRKLQSGPSSGTPFQQASELYEKSGHAFRYLCLGIQEQGNTTALFERAKELEVVYMTAQEMHLAPFTEVETIIEKFIAKVDIIYLTICLDVLDAAFAPGVSAPCTNGITPSMALEIIHCISRSGKVAIADIAELNPSYDIDNKTGKLAALLAYTIASQQ